MAKFKQGDIVVYDDKEYIVSSFDEINEEWVISKDEEEITVDETLLLTKEEYEELISESDDFEKDEETEEEVVDEEIEEVKAKDRSFEEDEEFEEEVTEETAAAQTIKAKPSAAMDSSKSQMMSSVIDAMAGMKKNDMIDFFNKMMAQIGHEAESISSGQASSNKSTIAAKPSAAKATQKEDFKEIISDVEGLTEEVQDKLATLFESAVHLRVTEIEKDLVEAYETKLEEETATISEEMAEYIDRYLSRVAETWVEENKVAIENNLRTEFTESFLTGLRDLFAEHYVDLPEDKVDVVEELVQRNKELEDALNEQVEANIELTESIEKYNAEEIFSEVAEGLAMNQVEQLRTLAEGIEFKGNAEDYEKKLRTIKEAHFKVKAPESTLNEEIEIDEEDENKTSKNTIVNPRVASYAAAISRTVKK